MAVVESNTEPQQSALESFVLANGTALALGSCLLFWAAVATLAILL